MVLGVFPCSIHPQVASPTKRGAELPAHTSSKPHSICCGMSNKDEEINKQGGIQSSSGTWGHCRVSWCEDWSPRITPLHTHPKNIIYIDLCTVLNLRFSGSNTYRVQILKALTFNNLQGNNFVRNHLLSKCTDLSNPYKQDLASF